MAMRLLPKKNEFYDFFDQASDHAVKAAALLVKMTENYADADPLARELDAVEHACDEVAHTTMDLLNKTFITPMDREDIHELILKIDDVVDLVRSGANRMAFFQVPEPTDYAVNMAKQILRGCESMSAAVHRLRWPKQYGLVSDDCIAIHEVENAADDILHHALVHLFGNEKDPLQIIMWKDIYETMEKTTDACEDVANVLQNVIVKMS